MKICSIVGARPQFIKLAPLVHAFNKQKGTFRHTIIHTGQHYDFNMSKIFFDCLKIPKPQYHLEAGSGPQGEQTGKILSKCEQVLLKIKPDYVIVFGDTNSTLGGALAARKLNIPIAHVEAGLRSFNRLMPEETNRILTDHCSDILFCPTINAVKNLKKEGFHNIVQSGNCIKKSQKSCLTHSSSPLVVNVGDIMYDTLLFCSQIAKTKSKILKRLNLKHNDYYLATVHRAENTNDNLRLKSILSALAEIANDHTVVFPVHPRTQKILRSMKSSKAVLKKLLVIDPVDYFDILILAEHAIKILTDSGGLQKEALFLRTPCVTLRDETEWIETLKGHWNTISGVQTNAILRAIKKRGPQKAPQHHFGQGDAADKIVHILKSCTK